MKLADAPSRPSVIPTEEDRQIAREASRLFAPHLNASQGLSVRIGDGPGRSEIAVLPAAAVRFLVELLSEMAKGNSVTMIPIHAELTTQEAANLLNVSRPFVVGLIEEKRLPARKVGTHRRILFSDLMAFKQQIDRDRVTALDELARQAQELNMVY